MLRFENHTNGRYYYISVEKDLFNELAVVVLRGGRNHRVIRTFGFCSREAIDAAIKRLCKRRIARGYILMNELTEKEMYEKLLTFAKELIENQKDLEPDFAKVLEDDRFDLYA